MSDALDCLEWIIKNYIGNDYYVYEEELITIKQALIKSQEQEEILSILKESPFILNSFFKSKDLKNQDEYDKKYFWGSITEDKVEKIKEWLDNEIK